MLRALRPVGEPVPIKATGAPRWQVPEGFDATFFHSGTAALAAVLEAIVNAAQVPGRPEVLMPAYTCPDVVSAIEYAGATAVLVDLEPGRPYLSPDALEACRSKQCVALVAVNFQGIDERMDELRAWCDRHALSLVYDHCQAFAPVDGAQRAADALVFSHGRGKPACALFGGQVWIQRGRNRALELAAPAVRAAAPSSLKLRLYNQLIRPRAYSLLLKVPGLGIGQTHYQRLEAVEGVDAEGERSILRAIDAHVASSVYATQRQWWADALATLDGWTDLPATCAAAKNRPLLRYTVLAPTAARRNQALEALQRAGLGATGLYPSIVSDIAGVEPLTRLCGDYPAARDFAARLLTLPVHSDVRQADVERAVAILSG